MKRIPILLLLVVGLCSCSTQTELSRPVVTYILQNEWSGLETRAYLNDNANHDAIYADYVKAYEKTGTPDPMPNEFYKTDVTDLTGVLCQAEKTQYSVERDAEIAVKVTYSETDRETDEDAVGIFCHRHFNLEYLTEAGWRRLIYVPASWYTDRGENTPILLKPGESFDGTVVLSAVATKLTPGKYRLVAYVNYEPVYAEFELTE